VKWSRTVVGAYAKGGVGGGVPLEANVESSWGGDTLSAGTATSSKYYPPSYFDIVSVSGASAGGVRIDAQQIGGDEKSRKKRNLLNEKLAASRTFVVDMALKNKLASKQISAKISYNSSDPEIIRSGLPAADRSEPRSLRGGGRRISEDRTADADEVTAPRPTDGQVRSAASCAVDLRALWAS
jgi:hypothetical protein